MRLRKNIFWKIVSRSRLDARGHPRRTNVIDDWLKRLFEQPRGWGVLRFFAPLKVSHSYATDVEPGENFTAKRIVGKSGLISFIVSQFDEAPMQLSWVEVGCCDCANLITLQKNGFSDLSGVEINEKFLKAGKRFDEGQFCKNSNIL